MSKRLAGRWLSGISTLSGLWILAATAVFQLPAGQFWNDVVAGSAIVVLAGVATLRGDDDGDTVATAASGLAALVGLWMMVAPITFETVGYKLASDFFGGLVVAGFSGYFTYVRTAVDQNVVKAGGHPAERST